MQAWCFKRCLEALKQHYPNSSSHLGMGQNWRPGTTDFSLFLVLTIELLGYPILTHTHLLGGTVQDFSLHAALVVSPKFWSFSCSWVNEGGHLEDAVRFNANRWVWKCGISWYIMVYPPSFQSNSNDDVNGFRGKVPYFQTSWNIQPRNLFRSCF